MSGWRDQAACRGMDTNLFFAERAADSARKVAAAKQVCEDCPVRLPCLETALSSQWYLGVWGGTSEKQRRAMRRAQRVA